MISTTIIYIDQLLTSFIFNLSHNLILDTFFGFFSLTGMSVLVWLIIFAYLVFIEEKKSRQFIIYFLLAIFSSTLAFTTIKEIVRRPRPLAKKPISTFQFPNSDSYPQDFSFPSGHATTAFSATCILSFFDRKRRRYFYLIALLIAFSRVYLGYHFFFDVVVGAVLGWTISFTILNLKTQMSKISKSGNQ